MNLKKGLQIKKGKASKEYKCKIFDSYNSCFMGHLSEEKIPLVLLSSIKIGLDNLSHFDLEKQEDKRTEKRRDSHV